MKKLLVLLFIMGVFFSSCRFITGQRIRGNGNVRTETRSPGNFKSVASHGSFDVFVSTGEQSVKIEAEENLLPYIETYVDGYTLQVDTKNDYWLSPSHKVKIFVSSPDYESIRSYGSGDITGESKITNSSKLELGVNGSANIKMDIDAPGINTETNGSGDIFLRGETKSFEGEIHGSGNIKALDLRSNDATIKIYGSGNADLSVDGKLDVHVAGSGDVNYKGNAQVSSSIAGSGRVKKID
ncbi:MAG TPA: head GIN domain-containing protein [Chitinophagaceae bacterium]|jgi:putative autotransporter adhesin-like protein|nr:head GIN domain-containing protein [Chitinophagaceae bacterium]